MKILHEGPIEGQMWRIHVEHEDGRHEFGVYATTAERDACMKLLAMPLEKRTLRVGARIRVNGHERTVAVVNREANRLVLDDGSEVHLNEAGPVLG